MQPDTALALEEGSQPGPEINSHDDFEQADVEHQSNVQQLNETNGYSGLDEDALDGLTYYPGIRQGEKRGPRMPPNRPGYQKAFLTLESPELDKYISSSHAEAFKTAEDDGWAKACKFEIESLKTLDT